MLACVRGLMRARAACEEDGAGSSLTSFRFHWFFRNIEGYGCTAPGCQCDAGIGQLQTLREQSNSLCKIQLMRIVSLRTLMRAVRRAFCWGSRLTLRTMRQSTDWGLTWRPTQMLKASRIVKPTHLWIAGDRRLCNFWSAQQDPCNPEAQGQWRHPGSDGGQSAAARWDRARLM